MEWKPAGTSPPRNTVRPWLIVLLILGAGLDGALILIRPAAAQSSADIARALDAVYDNRSIQRTLETGIEQPRPPPEAEPPVPAGRSRDGMGIFILWTLAAAIIVAASAMLVNEVPFLARNFRRRKTRAVPRSPGANDDLHAGPPAPEMDEVDRLAGQGRYGDAVHLLLLRAITALKDTLDKGIVPALTSREVQVASGLAEVPDAALRILVQTVERSHFGGRPVTEQDYLECRESHGALAGLRPARGARR